MVTLSDMNKYENDTSATLRNLLTLSRIITTLRMTWTYQKAAGCSGRRMIIALTSIPIPNLSILIRVFFPLLFAKCFLPWVGTPSTHLKYLLRVVYIPSRIVLGEIFKAPPALQFDWLYSGELVVWLNSHSAWDREYSSIANWGPLSDITSVIPYRVKWDLVHSTTVAAVVSGVWPSSK